MITSALASFGRFWYRFIVGDDWTIAASIFITVVVVFALHAARIAAWWLMPIVVLATLGFSLYRAHRQDAAGRP